MSLKAKWARLSPNEQKVVIGSASALVLGFVGVTAYYAFRPKDATGAANKTSRRWPVSTYRGIISGFGASRPDGRLHAAVDIGTVPGDAILAVDDGTVLRMVGGYEIGAGLQAVAISHPDGDYIYAEIKSTVLPGQQVKAGDVIGYAAKNADGNSMLHFEVWEKGMSPTYFTKWFPGKKPAGLLNAAEVASALPKEQASV